VGARPDRDDGAAGTDGERRDRLALASTLEAEGMGPAADAMGKRLFGPDPPRVLSLPGVGHLPNLERPDDFNRELLAFLDASAP
jgi:pimeloyl-ACP methyl ester carboxylesterase